MYKVFVKETSRGPEALSQGVIPYAIAHLICKAMVFAYKAMEFA